MFGTPDTTAATCFIGSDSTVIVVATSGFAVTASIARTTSAAAGSVRAVWVSTATDVTPESTATRGKAGQAYR